MNEVRVVMCWYIVDLLNYSMPNLYFECDYDDEYNQYKVKASDENVSWLKEFRFDRESIEGYTHDDFNNHIVSYIKEIMEEEGFINEKR